MVFITTILRCSCVQHSADTLLLQYFADRCQPVAVFTAFMLRCRLDIQDHTTMLCRPRRLYDDIATMVPIIRRLKYVSCTILAMMCLYLGFQTSFFTSFQLLNMNGRINADLGKVCLHFPGFLLGNILTFFYIELRLNSGIIRLSSFRGRIFCCRIFKVLRHRDCNRIFFSAFTTGFMGHFQFLQL